jgi:hypothetical protein
MLSFVSNSAEPWRELPPSVADLLEPELPAITAEINSALGQEVPEYARPLEGAFGEAVRAGVEEALRRFIAMVRDSDPPDDPGRQMYIALGRGEMRAGRTLDALQAAYRVGARVAWRGFARATQAAGTDAEISARLAEAIFAYIDELSAESVEGYAQAQAELAGERDRQRAELVAALLGGAPGVDPAALALPLGWPLPRTAATVACPTGRAAGLARRLGSDTLFASFEAVGCVIVPDAEGPGRRELIRVASRGRLAAIGPDVPTDRLSLSWQLATAALDLADGRSLAVADEHLAELLVRFAAPVIERIAERRLAPLDQLTPAAHVRMKETALAYVQHVGNAAAIGRDLHVHPQTARYRVARLRELLGDQLDDPDARFELEAALRAQGDTRPQGPLQPGR